MATPLLCISAKPITRKVVEIFTVNYPITIAGSLIFLAFLAHTFVGYRESLSTRPRKEFAASAADAENIERNWVQMLCAFQWVAVDLLFFSVLLLVLGATDFLPAKREISLVAAGLLTLWGCAFLVPLLLLQRRWKDYLLLWQWAFCFLCAGLLVWGAQKV